MRHTGLAAWSLRCPSCRTWASKLPVAINSPGSEAIDEGLRETALAALREHNNRRVVDRIVALGGTPGQRVLDVGCAHGWFVLAARQAGLDAEGIEPDEEVAGVAARNGVRVRVGLFPDVLAPQEQYDVITFNDVLEHLPDVRAAVAACHDHLRPGGLLSINIPNSRGLVH
jgi:2-polyprenyl-3-methyl-5-hydroxy-6-metoxy-1,4-benzoquinol methylase